MIHNRYFSRHVLTSIILAADHSGGKLEVLLNLGRDYGHNGDGSQKPLRQMLEVIYFSVLKYASRNVIVLLLTTSLIFMT